MPPPQDAPSRILIIRPSSLGDVIRTVPAVVSFRKAWPRTRIDWLVNDTLAPAVQHHPDVSSVIPFPRAALGTFLRHGNLTAVAEWVRTMLRDPGYDLVIDYQGLLRSGLLTLATRSPRRLGYADARELGWLGYTERISVTAPHHVDRVLELTKAAGAEPVADLRLYPDPKDQAALSLVPGASQAAEHAPLPPRFALLAPTTRGIGRAWPIDRYAALAGQLLERRKELNIDAIVVTGMKDERDYCRPLLALAHPALIDRIGKTTVSGLMALIERASLVVCNDSAAMHMAVAFNRPMVALFGASDIAHAGPYLRRADVISHKRPDEHARHRDVPKASELMRRISVEEVVAACAKHLQG